MTGRGFQRTGRFLQVAGIILVVSGCLLFGLNIAFRHFLLLPLNLFAVGGGFTTWYFGGKTVRNGREIERLSR